VVALGCAPADRRENADYQYVNGVLPFRSIGDSLSHETNRKKAAEWLGGKPEAREAGQASKKQERLPFFGAPSAIPNAPGLSRVVSIVGTD